MNIHVQALITKESLINTEEFYCLTFLINKIGYFLRKTEHQL